MGNPYGKKVIIFMNFVGWPQTKTIANPLLTRTDSKISRHGGVEFDHPIPSRIEIVSDYWKLVQPRHGSGDRATDKNDMKH
jgi:hypothetical protein